MRKLRTVAHCARLGCMFEPGDVPVEEAAVLLHLTVPEALSKADQLIGRWVQTNGIESARGMSTHQQMVRDQMRVAFTPLLFERLRDDLRR